MSGNASTYLDVDRKQMRACGKERGEIGAECELARREQKEYSRLNRAKQ